MPVLTFLDLYSAAACKLLLHTAVHESGGLKYIAQIRGPALGLFQMEPRTFYSHCKWLERPRRQMLKSKVEMLGGAWPQRHKQLVGNLFLSVAFARIHYLRVRAPLPDPDDMLAQAQYWKQYWNTYRGRGTVKQFLAKNQ